MLGFLAASAVALVQPATAPDPSQISSSGAYRSAASGEISSPDAAVQAIAGSLPAHDATAMTNPQDKLIVYDEDYSGLSDPALRTNLWTRLKYIPLPGDNYLSLGGESRTRLEFRDEQRFGLGPQDNNGNVEQRTRLWADLHIGKHIRTFFELKSGVEIGYSVPQTLSDRKPVDVGQAFVEWNNSLGNNGSVTLRVGRQEISIGSFRLFDVRDGLNVR